MQRVFENLLSNAIKYSPHGGAIEIDVARNDSNAVVMVQDCGIGISDALPHLFDRGYRAREAVATAPGLGLGLNIASEIVKRHGGSIEARGTEQLHHVDPGFRAMSGGADYARAQPL